ncbi:MAG: hypothetical protein JNK02_03470 [Planctomycetes bacterium]|nr:hypothetical protein [Planctomycetota bacterium]
MRPILLSGLLLLAACGGSDPRSLSNQGYALLGKGDARGALAKFDAALSGLAPSSPDYLRTAIGRCEALAKTNGAQAQRAFLDLAAAMPAKIGEDDYSLVCSRLLEGGFTLEAVEVMHAGNTRFEGSKKMADTLAAVQAAARREKTPDALKRLESLGYAGG